MPAKKTQGEKLEAEVIEALTAEREKKNPDADSVLSAANIRVFCIMATQLERIADRMDDIMNIGVPEMD